ncbi:MAG: ABC transporter permease, partial [Anaerolineae bacterium]
MVLGIALGVAVVVAVDLANVSARRAFDLSVDSVAGRATHQIVGGPQGLDEASYATLRRTGVVRAAAPIVAAYATSPQLGGRPIQLLGVDPFAEAPFRSYLSAGETIPVDQLTAFLTQPRAVLIAAGIAEQYEMAPGDILSLDVAGRQRDVMIAGLLEPPDDLSRRTVEGIVLADIATAQELTDRIGRLDRIDLILPEHSEHRAREIEVLLRRTDNDAAIRVIPLDQRTGATRQMTASFRLNLTALSLLALVVGMFLIYNTMTFSVVQRRSLFGILRSLGVTQREVFAMVLGESLLIGVISSALGLALGILMGQSAVAAVSRTVSDLYFVLTVRAVAVPPVSLVKGTILGVGATLAAAAPPAREAATVSPRAALSRSGLEAKARQAALATAVGGLASIAVGVAALVLPTSSLIVGFGATFLIVLGFALLTPSVTKSLMEVIRP